MMVVLSMLWLLAAFFSTVIAGPVPQHFRRVPSPYYSNASSIASPTSPEPFEEPGTVTDLWSPVPGTSSVAPTVEVDTAVVVEPIQRTVYTNTQPAITYVDPEGQPMITQPEETILSTSFVSKSSETPALQDTPDASISTPSQLSSTTETTPPPTESPAQPEASSDASSTTSTPANIPKVSDGSLTLTSTGYGGPQFTYIPRESEAESESLASVTTTEAKTTNTASAAQSTAGSGADTISCSGPNTKHQQNSTVAAIASSTRTDPTEEGNSTLTTAPDDGPSLVVVTQTQYTTVFPTTAVAEEPGATPSSANTSSGPPSAIPTLTERPGASVSSSSTAGLLPSTSLSPPPAVTGTQTSALTSASPPVSSASTIGNDQPPASSTAVEQPSGTITSAPSSLASEPSAPSNTAEPQPTSNFGGGFVYPTQQPASATTSSITISSTTDAAPPAPTGTAPAPSLTSSEPASSSASDSPLIVTPINPSQIFTITVTATATEKETVTETSTVTA